jgi:hypothetical protein
MHTWEDNIKMDLGKVVCKVMTQDGIQRQAFVNMVINLSVPQKQHDYELFKEDFFLWS